MANYFKTILLYGFTMFKRSVRDPLTSIILIGLPVVLLVIFGLLLGGDQNITIRTTIINYSTEELALNFEQTLRDTEVLQVAEDSLTLDQAQERMRNGEFDTIIELPGTFGVPNEQGLPVGDITVYVSPADPQTNEIVFSIIGGIADEYNRQLIGIEMPLNIVPQSISATTAKAIHYLFGAFAALGLLMVGTLGIASLMPTDKKNQILRRLHVTPLRKSQVVLGTGLAFTILGIGVAILLTAIAIIVFDMEIASNPLTLAVFMFIGLLLMIGLGLAVGGIAKNPTQGESIGQIIFIGSMALSGIWIPTALMPEFLQNIAAFMPLTPVVNGIRTIVTEQVSLLDLTSELSVIAVWAIITYLISFKTFRWE